MIFLWCGYQKINHYTLQKVVSDSDVTCAGSATSEVDLTELKCSMRAVSDPAILIGKFFNLTMLVVFVPLCLFQTYIEDPKSGIYSWIFSPVSLSSDQLSSILDSFSGVEESTVGGEGIIYVTMNKIIH